MPVYYFTLAAGLIVTAGFLFSRSKGASVKTCFSKWHQAFAFCLQLFLQ